MENGEEEGFVLTFTSFIHYIFMQMNYVLSPTLGLENKTDEVLSLMDIYHFTVRSECSCAIWCSVI